MKIVEDEVFLGETALIYVYLTKLLTWRRLLC